MITFKSISIKNFLSYGNIPTVIQLDRPGTTLILGENLDDTASGTGANGVGKAQPLHCKVKTPKGWTTIGECCVGDLLTSPNGRTTSVIGVYPQGSRPVYKITFADGRHTEADQDHLWKVFSHRWGNAATRGEKTLTTLELKDYVDESRNKNKAWYNIFVPVIVPADQEDAQLLIDPYILGVFLGDGGMTDKSPTLSSADNQIIDRVNGYLESECSQYLRKFGNSTIDYVVCNKKTRSRGNTFRDKLKQLGLWEVNSYTKYIPQSYIDNCSINQRYQLLQGLLDTDGTVGKTKNVSFSSSSQKLAHQVQYIVRSLGGKAKLSVRQPFYKDRLGNRKNGVISYNVSIDIPNPTKLFTLPRKLIRLSVASQYANAGLHVISVEYIGDKITQCIKVDSKDQLYITDDFIVTHNTTLINALAYAIYDKPISNISKDNLVNNINKKNMEVSIEFEMKGKNYQITRTRKAKAGASGNFVQVIEDGKDITPDSVSSTNEEVEKIIGIPYDLFVHIVTFTATLTPFLDLPLRAQADLIEELFDLKTLSEKADALKAKIKSTEQSLAIHLARVDQLKKEHERHEKQLQSAIKRAEGWAEQNKTDIADIQRKLKKLENVDVDAQRALHAEHADVTALLNESQSALRDLERELKEHVKVKNERTKELKHLQDAKCPYCMQKFEDAAKKIAECKIAIAGADEHIVRLTPELEVMYEEVEAHKVRQADIKSKITVGNVNELLEIKSKSSQYQQKLQELQQATNPFDEPLKELTDIELDPLDMTQVNELKSTIDHQKFLLKLLTKKDSFVRKALLNKNIPFLNTRLSHYLTQLGLPHTVEFTHEMAAEISQFGRPMDFGNLSNGQRARVNIALSFAFRDVLQSLHDKINICLLDEVLDVGLDAVGVQAAAKMLKRKARDEGLALFIISHRDEIDSAFDRKMIVQMTKGFSYVKYEDD